MKITTKRQFTTLWEQGTFGNLPIIWPSIEDAVRSGYGGWVALRYRGAGSGGPLATGLTADRLPEAMWKLEADGWKEKDFYVYEDVPTESIRINGELCERPGRFDLTYSTVPKRMRESLAEGRRLAEGLVAKAVLSTYLTPDDVEHLYRLLDEYPEHVIEFSGFADRVGIQQSHMIIWEVRLY